MGMDLKIASIAIYDDGADGFYALIDIEGNESNIVLPPEMAKQLPYAIAMMKKQAELLG